MTSPSDSGDVDGGTKMVKMITGVSALGSLILHIFCQVRAYARKVYLYLRT
jgi:hypothetical protein